MPGRPYAHTGHEAEVRAIRSEQHMAEGHGTPGSHEMPTLSHAHWHVREHRDVKFILT